VAEVEPGNPNGYLEAATVFWDYYLFDDALRLIQEGRKKLSNAALYAYEAGAVYENKRDYARAVAEYVQGALAEQDRSTAQARLLLLAKRPQHRSLVDQATSKSVAGANPSAAAVNLRVAVLEALDRRDDLEKFLTTLTQNAMSLELLERIEPIAERQGFDSLRERSLERRIGLTTDPVERLRSRLALARFHEAKGDVAAARRVMESLFADNPTLLGVVRATVDFYWRNKIWDSAIDTLLRAAGASYPALKQQFTFEAAHIATDAKQYARARELLAPLLQIDAHNGEYLAAVADTYAREGDDRALGDFYLAKIQGLREAPLAPDDRTARVAALRRGLIPALTRLKDFAGAVDQYVEILNRYPEDEGLCQEAAAYADRYNRRKQLLDYYTKATADSARDYRWPMVLARLQTSFEDYPAAIASYSRARQVRPDRSDLLLTQAALEERLMRFDDAARSYAEVYDLTYHNPQWMEKVAETCARQGQTEAAVEALRKALIEGRPERPLMFFDAARRLESWNMLPQAREFAERGVSLAGNELLANNDHLEGARIYARVM
jgi:tetratricopeptide (TPR) repeat protein